MKGKTGRGQLPSPAPVRTTAAPMQEPPPGQGGTGRLGALYNPTPALLQKSHQFGKSEELLGRGGKPVLQLHPLFTLVHTLIT